MRQADLPDFCSRVQQHTLYPLMYSSVFSAAGGPVAAVQQCARRRALPPPLPGLLLRPPLLGLRPPAGAARPLGHVSAATCIVGRGCIPLPDETSHTVGPSRANLPAQAYLCESGVLDNAGSTTPLPRPSVPGLTCGAAARAGASSPRCCSTKLSLSSSRSLARLGNRAAPGGRAAARERCSRGCSAARGGKAHGRTLARWQLRCAGCNGLFPASCVMMQAHRGLLQCRPGQGRWEHMKAYQTSQHDCSKM